MSLRETINDYARNAGNRLYQGLGDALTAPINAKAAVLVGVASYALSGCATTGANVQQAQTQEATIEHKISTSNDTPSLPSVRKVDRCFGIAEGVRDYGDDAHSEAEKDFETHCGPIEHEYGRAGLYFIFQQYRYFSDGPLYTKVIVFGEYSTEPSPVVQSGRCFGIGEYGRRSGSMNKTEAEAQNEAEKDFETHCGPLTRDKGEDRISDRINLPDYGRVMILREE